MREVVPWVLAGWVLATLVLFWRKPGRDAALASMLLGWAILPVMDYPASVFRDNLGNGGFAHAVTIAGGPLANKAAAIGLGCLGGLIAMDWTALRRVRWGWIDATMALWCAIPLASSMANGLAPSEALAQARDQVLTWGTPYLVGRVYLGDSESLARFSQWLVFAAMLMTPLMVLEILVGPFLYGLFYGPHPYQIEGASRPLLWRPLLFQEHGNQFGIWIASAAVAAVWLWRSGRSLLPWRLPWIPFAPGMMATWLVAITLVCQSHGAIILGALALVPLAFRGLRDAREHAPPWRVSGLGGVTLILVVLGVAVSGLGVAAASSASLRGGVRAFFVGLGKQSFTWRLARSEESLRLLAERPVLGWADRDWSNEGTGGPLNPVNMSHGLLVCGMYGGVGLLVWAGALLVPSASALRRLGRGWSSPRGSAVALAAVLVLLNVGDSFLNSTWLPPMTAAAGGLSAWASRLPASRG